MTCDALIARARRFAKPYRVTSGERFRLRDVGALAAICMSRETFVRWKAMASRSNPMRCARQQRTSPRESRRRGPLPIR